MKIFINLKTVIKSIIITIVVIVIIMFRPFTKEAFIKNEAMMMKYVIIELAFEISLIMDLI